MILPIQPKAIRLTLEQYGGYGESKMRVTFDTPTLND